jgi:N-acetylmuramoyl-L-alanine amidase
MIRQYWHITSFGFPVASVMAFLILLFSSPLHSNTGPINVSTVRFAHGNFVSVDTFAKTIGLTPHATPENHKLTLSISNHRVVLTRQSSVIKIDQEIFRMPNTVFPHNGHLYIPEQAATLIAQYLNVVVAFHVSDAVIVASKRPDSPSGNDLSSRPKQPKKDLVQNAASWKLNTVVIDPGHGGKDPGAIGHGGTYEKTIVLGVAKQLKSLLEKQLKVNVILTRGDDTFIPLGKRSKMAIQQDGKVFISLHCNATKNRNATGVEVYFLSEAKTKSAAQVAQDENAVLEKYEGVSADSLTKGLDRIRYSLLSSQFLKESQDLAADIHNAIVGHIPSTTPRGVKQANFYVMRGTMGQMPSVLVELGFVTNRAEEKKLKSSAHQKKLAEALYQGIKTFKQHYEQQLSTDSS